MIKEVKNPVFLNDGNIQTEILTDEFPNEWLSFVASSEDCMDYGRQLFHNLIDGKYGEIAPYILPTKQDIYDNDLSICIENRQEAYSSESDPLRMEYEYEKEIGTEKTINLAKQAWINKIREIKEKLPKPTNIK